MEAEVIKGLIEQGGGWLTSAVLLSILAYEARRHAATRKRLDDVTDTMAELVRDSATTLQALAASVDGIARTSRLEDEVREIRRAINQQ